MSQIRPEILLPDVKRKDFFPEFVRALSYYIRELADAFNGGIRLTSENINCQTKTVSDSGSADTEFAVAHTLKRVPDGYLVVSIDKAAVVYKGTTTWTATNIYLKSNVANCEVKLILF